jgi:hypothetical protein
MRSRRHVEPEIAAFSEARKWQAACLKVGVTKLSKVNTLRPDEDLRSLYARRADLVRTIEALEQLQALRAQRSNPEVLALLAANRHLCGRRTGARPSLAA